jgi:ABC-2 type transport system permease protein
MSLRQIKLVLQREYMTRIRSKGFIAATILIPVGFLVIMGVGVGITLWSSTPAVKVGIADHTGQIYPRLQKIDPARYVSVSGLGADSLRTKVSSGQLSGYIRLNDDNISGAKNPELIYGGSGGITLVSSIQHDLQRAFREERLERADVPANVRKIYSDRVHLNSRKLTKEGQGTETHTDFLSGIGLAMGIIIFMSLFGYGGLLVRSVIEEKTSRIVEVIASSVKPVELLIGKMAGIAALGITQIIFWIAAFLVFSTAAGSIAGLFMHMPAVTGAAGAFNPTNLQIPAIDPMIFIYFLLFFLLGYLLYSTFFAAIGAAVDSRTDTQQFMFPIMLPIIIAYFIMFQTIQHPDSSLSVIGSLIPFFSPIVMITRIAITNVPFWQIALSMFLIILTFSGTMWVCTKIYRVGILSYGKSAGYKELLKWVRE